METIIIDDQEVVKVIISCMDKINQVMKSISNNTKGYTVNQFEAYSFDSVQIPRKVNCLLKLDGLQKKQQALLEPYLDYMFYDVKDGVDLFQFIRDFKKEINKIEITENEFIIYAQLIQYKLIRNGEMRFITDNVKEEDELVNFNLTDEKLLEKFYKYRGIMSLYVDIDNSTISIDEVPYNSESYLKLTISHKYLQGFSKLKSDGKSFINFKVACTNLTEDDNVFSVFITPESKNFKTINNFCVVDM